MSTHVYRPADRAGQWSDRRDRMAHCVVREVTCVRGGRFPPRTGEGLRAA